MVKTDIAKFDSTNPDHISLALGEMPFSWFSTPVFLDYCGYVIAGQVRPRITVHDRLYPNQFPCLFLPRDKQDWTRCLIVYAQEKDISALISAKVAILLRQPVGEEFFFHTGNFTHPTGSVRRMTRLFGARNAHSVLSQAKPEKIKDFYRTWANQRPHEDSFAFEEDWGFFEFCLNHLDRYNIKQCYVEIGNRLVGLAWGIAAPERNGWVLLQRKVCYDYKGLSRYILHKLACDFADFPVFATGTGCQDSGIIAHKKSLHPCRVVSYSYLITGEMLTE